MSLLLNLWSISTTRLKYLGVVGVKPLPVLPLPFSPNKPRGLRLDPPVLHWDQCLSTLIHRDGWESTFSFSPCHIFFLQCLSSDNKSGLNHKLCVEIKTTSSHLLIELVLPLNPTYFSQSTHSRNISQTQAFLFLFFIRKTLFANLISSLYYSFQPFIFFTLHRQLL